jgi:hypothetical protein
VCVCARARALCCGQVLVGQLGGVRSIMQAMQRFGDVEVVQKNGCGALRNLAFHATNQQQIFNFGGVPVRWVTVAHSCGVAPAGCGSGLPAPVPSRLKPARMRAWPYSSGEDPRNLCLRIFSRAAQPSPHIQPVEVCACCSERGHPQELSLGGAPMLGLLKAGRPPL